MGAGDHRRRGRLRRRARLRRGRAVHARGGASRDAIHAVGRSAGAGRGRGDARSALGDGVTALLPRAQLRALRPARRRSVARSCRPPPRRRPRRRRRCAPTAISRARSRSPGAPSDDPNVTAYASIAARASADSFERLGHRRRALPDHLRRQRASAICASSTTAWRRCNRAGGEGRASEPVRAVTKPEPLPPLGLRVGAQRPRREPSSPGSRTSRPNLVGYRLMRQRAGSTSARLVAMLPADQTTARGHGVASADESDLRTTLVAIDETASRAIPRHPSR